MLGKTGLEINRLGFGGIPIQRVNERQAVEVVLHAIESGVDFIDTSRAYTTSERRIGLALKQSGRKVVLASKSHDREAEGIRIDLEESLDSWEKLNYTLRRKPPVIIRITMNLPGKRGGYTDPSFLFQQ